MNCLYCQYTRENKKYNVLEVNSKLFYIGYMSALQYALQRAVNEQHFCSKKCTRCNNIKYTLSAFIYRH